MNLIKTNILTSSTLRSAMALILTLVVVFKPVPAQAVFASEFTQVLNQLQLLLQKVQDAGEYVETQQQRVKEVQDMQRKLTNLTKMFDLLNMPVRFDLAKRDEQDGVKERCPGSSPGFSVGAIIDRIKPAADGDIMKQQTAICQSIVILENRKHNELVSMYTHANEKIGQINGQLMKSMKSSSDPGVATAAQNNAQAMLNQSMSEMEYSSSKIEGYNSLIASLKNDQANLARTALKGTNNVLGTIVKTSALAAALKVNKSN